MGKIHLTVLPTQGGFQILDVTVDGNGFADWHDAAELELPPDLSFEQGIILNGKASVWLHGYLSHRCAAAPWIAIFDPRFGALVVAASDTQAPHTPGAVIPLSALEHHIPRGDSARPGKVIAFVGPPHSGKTVLVGALFRQLAADDLSGAFRREAFLVTACPDGEGKWSHEIPQEQARILRFKKAWDEEFVAHSCDTLAILAKTKRLVLADLGGKIDERNARILAYCTHAVIVSSDPDAFEGWRIAAERVGVEVLAEIESSPATESTIVAAQPLRLRIGALRRGAPALTLPSQLADLFM